MAKLTKSELKSHQAACQLLEKKELTFDEKCFVYENWQEGANFENSRAGAFFTPIELANDFKFHVGGNKIIDLCAGTGVLSFMYYHCSDHKKLPDITCVEINPVYVEIGKKLFPEANWVCGDIGEIWKDLDQFEHAIANPPFGNRVAIEDAPCYTGNIAEYRVIDIASKIAKTGAFIVPQGSVPFVYSGSQYYREREVCKYARFNKETGISFDFGCGVDTSIYKKDWHGVAPVCEIVCCDF